MKQMQKRGASGWLRAIVAAAVLVLGVAPAAAQTADVPPTWLRYGQLAGQQFHAATQVVQRLLGVAGALQQQAEQFGRLRILRFHALSHAHVRDRLLQAAGLGIVHRAVPHVARHARGSVANG